MADSSAVPSSSAARSRVVRSLARAAERPCARPGCPAPARATLTFAYATAEVHLDRLSDVADPQRYDLCARHAARTEPPRGWALTDRRPDEDRAELEPPAPSSRDLGSEATVAVLAAALRAVPDVPPVPTPPTGEPPTGEAPTAEAPTADVPTATPPAPTAGDAEPAPDPAPRADERDGGPRRRRRVVETLLATPDAGQPARPGARDVHDEPTVELPAVRTPRRVPAAGDRGPATDW